MRLPTPRPEGFTLVEIIASLVLVGILSSVAGMFIVTGMKSYELAKGASEGALKAQIAISRIYSELMRMDPTWPVTVTPGTSISYRHTELTPNETRTISYSSAQKRIELTTGAGTYPLIGGISSFSLTGTAVDIDGDGQGELAAVDLAFTIDGIGRTFALRAFPRNLLPE